MCAWKCEYKCVCMWSNNARSGKYSLLLIINFVASVHARGVLTEKLVDWKQTLFETTRPAAAGTISFILFAHH